MAEVIVTMKNSLERVALRRCVQGGGGLWEIDMSELRKTKNGKSGDSGPPVASYRPLFNYMNFIMDTVKHKRYNETVFKCVAMIKVVFFHSTSTNFPTLTSS